MNPSPLTKLRGGALDRREATKAMSVIASSFIVMNIVMLFSLLVDKAGTQVISLAPAARWRSLFAVEALSAKAMYRTGRSAARPTATEIPHCGRRPAAGMRLPLTRPGHRPPHNGAAAGISATRIVSHSYLHLCQM